MNEQPRWPLLAALLLCCACSDSGVGPGSTPDPTPYAPPLPETFPALESPPRNPLTIEGVELGRALFFDPILSADSSVACASCHLPEFAFSDPQLFSRGAGGHTRRNSMALINLAWAPALFWDGRAPDLESQALEPVEDPDEMGETWERVEEKLRRHREYPRLFARAFGDSAAITRTLAARALAQFERTLVSSSSRYDRWVAGQEALTSQEEQGFLLFHTERGDCFHCHVDPLFTDNRFHNTGLDPVPPDSGRAAVTGLEADWGRFRTPTLRNVEFTAPYMHDGRFATLEEVVDFYDTGVHYTRRTDPLLLARRQLHLSAAEKAALVAFLKTLSDPAFIAEHH